VVARLVQGGFALVEDTDGIIVRQNGVSELGK
jgi:hypothetical protein